MGPEDDARRLQFARLKENTKGRIIEVESLMEESAIADQIW